MVEITRYEPLHAALWNDFVARSKNGTFLFNRDYMDYHADRFSDCSLLVFERREKRGGDVSPSRGDRIQQRLLALLPANRVGNDLYTHQGLTYGGLVISQRVSIATVCDIFRAVNIFLRALNIKRIVYKPVPWIYHPMPSEEDLYAITHVCGARLIDRQVSSALTFYRPAFTESRRGGIRKAIRSGLTVGQSRDVDAFWDILEGNLGQRHHTRPVHTSDEMKQLMSRFPDNIKLYMVYDDTRPVGGAVVYETSQVAHTQYISATEEGKRRGALDLLFDELLHNVYTEKPCFDFGTSMTDGHLNRPLIFQKEGFGARTVCYDCYEWEII